MSIEVIMIKKEILKEKIEHLKYDQQLLLLCKPMLYSEEQKQHNNKKIEFLESWIKELEEALDEF